MSTSPLLLNPEKKPAKRSLLVPIVLLGILVVAFFVELRWTRSMTAGRVSLFHQTPAGWQKLPAPSAYPESLRISKGGTVWTLNEPGAVLSRWDGARWQDYKDPGFRRVYMDRDFALDGEQLWAATELGVLHWDGQKWHTDRSITAGFESSIVAGGGEVWVIDSAGKLSHFSDGQWKSHTVELPGMKWAEDVQPPQLARTEDGTLWLGYQGLWRWDGANWTRMTDGQDTLLHARLAGAAGNRIWLSDVKELRSLSLDGKQWTVYPNQKIGLTERVRVREAAYSGTRTWFATTRGILEFDGSNWRKPTLPDRLGIIYGVNVSPDGSLWIMGAPPYAPARTQRILLILFGLTPLAGLLVVVWIVKRFRRRQMDQHQRVAQAVQHATGEVPEELEAGAHKLKSNSAYGLIFLGIGTGVGYLVLRRFWPAAPYWTIAAIGLTLHLLMTFQESLIKRRPKPSDPIGPGAPSRYDWAKSWKAVAGAAALLLLLNIDKLPMLRFLRGYWWWIFLLGPTVYQALAMLLYSRAAKRGEYDAALNIIRWTNFYNPSGVEALRMSGNILVVAGRYREAEDTLRRSLASSQARESYGAALENLGEALLEQGRYNEAARSYEAALLAFPWRHRPYRGMAEMILRRGEKPEQALEYIEKILDFSGISWRQRKANGNARDDYWSLKAWALARMGRGSEVADAIESALRATNQASAPDMAATHYRAGMAMQALGDEPSANEHFKLAILFDPHGRRGALAQAALKETNVWGTVRV
jgi:tetratricopeptide (TPR) repeat protein